MRRLRRATRRREGEDALHALIARLRIPSLDTTECSIEEIASRILNTTGIERRLRP